jgi:hypothetical protein
MPDHIAKMTQKPDPQKRVREAVRLFLGQANRKEEMFADVLLDLIERVDKLEKERQKIAA